MTNCVEIDLPGLVALSELAMRLLRDKSASGEIESETADLFAEYLMLGFKGIFPKAPQFEAYVSLSCPPKPIDKSFADFHEYAETSRVDKFKEISEYILRHILLVFIATNLVQILICVCHLGKSREDVAKLKNIIDSILNSVPTTGEGSNDLSH